MFDFPDAPVLDEVVSSPDGTTYYWDGTKWVMEVVSGAYVPLDGSLPMTGGLEINLPLAHGAAGLTIDGTANTDNPTIINLRSDAAYWSIVAGHLAGARPGSFYIEDANTALTRFEIEADPAGLPSAKPFIIRSDGAVQIGNLLQLSSDFAVYPGPDIGPFIFSDGFGLSIRGLDNGIMFSETDGTTVANLGSIRLGSDGQTEWVITTGNTIDGTLICGDIIVGGLLIDTSNNGSSTLELNLWGGTVMAGDNTIRIQIAGAATASAVHPAGGLNLHNAGAHVFRSYDTLTEYARIDGTGITVGGVPIGGGGGLDQATADGLYANIAGDTFTGPVLLAGAPTLPLHAATMGWVESVIGAAGGGTITGVTAGAGLTGGGTTGGVTLSLTAPVTIALGGTNATTAAAALTNLGGLSQAVADTLYLGIATDLFTQAEADLLYLNISTGDYLTTAEGNAAYLPIATDLFTQVDADLLYLPIATDLFTQVEADARYLGLAGGTLAGPLVLAGPPTLALHAATMQYVLDSMGAAGGGTITGVTAGAGLAGGGTTGTVTVSLAIPVAIASGGTNAIDAATALTNLGGISQTAADARYLGIATDLFTQAEADLLYMPIASDFLTQAEADLLYLTPAAAAAAYLPITTDLFTQAEADALFLTPAEADLAYLPIATNLFTQTEADARYLGLAGGTLTGALVLSGPPTLALHAATMAYVDAQVGGGLTQAEADLLYLPIATDLFTQAEADALFLTPAEGNAAYLGIATDLFTQAEADLLYMPIASDFLTQAEGDARYLTSAAAAATYLPLTTDLFTQAEADARYLAIATDLFTQADADLLYLTPAAAAAAYLPISTDLFTQAEADALFLTPAEGDARYLAIATDLLTTAEADAAYVNLAGDVMTGQLTVPLLGFAAGTPNLSFDTNLNTFWQAVSIVGAIPTLNISRDFGSSYLSLNHNATGALIGLNNPVPGGGESLQISVPDGPAVKVVASFTTTGLTVDTGIFTLAPVATVVTPTQPTIFATPGSLQLFAPTVGIYFSEVGTGADWMWINEGGLMNATGIYHGISSLGSPITGGGPIIYMDADQSIFTLGGGTIAGGTTNATAFRWKNHDMTNLAELGNTGFFTANGFVLRSSPSGSVSIQSRDNTVTWTVYGNASALRWFTGLSDRMILDNTGNLTVAGIVRSEYLNVSGTMAALILEDRAALGSANGWEQSVTNNKFILFSATSMVYMASFEVASFILGSTEAYKAVGGPWVGYSDIRVKQDVTDYTTGLAAIRQLRPVNFRFNGDYSTPNNGVIYQGLVADEAELVMPEIVGSIQKTRNPVPHGETPDPTMLDDLKTLAPNALTYAIINALKEIADRLEVLEVAGGIAAAPRQAAPQPTAPTPPPRPSAQPQPQRRPPPRR
jgi:hypothetical protein